MKFRTIISVLAMAIVAALYAFVQDSDNSNYNSGGSTSTGSDFSADSIGSMRN